MQSFFIAGGAQSILALAFSIVGEGKGECINHAVTSSIYHHIVPLFFVFMMLVGVKPGFGFGIVVFALSWFISFVFKDLVCFSFLCLYPRISSIVITFSSPSFFFSSSRIGWVG